MGGIYSFGLIAHWWHLFYFDLLYMGTIYLLGLIVHGVISTFGLIVHGWH